MCTLALRQAKSLVASHSSTQVVSRSTSHKMVAHTTTTSRRPKTAQSTSAPLRTPSSTCSTTMDTLDRFTVLGVTHSGIPRSVQSSFRAPTIGLSESGMPTTRRLVLFVTTSIRSSTRSTTSVGHPKHLLLSPVWQTTEESRSGIFTKTS